MTLKPSKRMTKKQKGDQAEQLARDYLQQKGLVFIQSNFTSRFGEVDLIMRDPETGNTVFVEVRYRKNKQFGGSATSVIPKKQHRIIKTALYYLQTEDPNAAVRFDVVAIDGDIDGDNTIDWIIDAFQ